MSSTQPQAAPIIPELRSVYGKLLPRRARVVRNPAATKLRIYEALAAIARRDGLHSLKISQLAREANVSKERIYKYYGSLEELLDNYKKQTDLILPTSDDYYMPENLGGSTIINSIQAIYRRVIQLYNKNADVRAVGLGKILDFRKNYGPNNPQQVRRYTANAVRRVLANVSTLTPAEIDAMDTVITCAIVGMLIYEDCVDTYNDVNLQTDEGWERISVVIDGIVSRWLEPHLSDSTSGKTPLLKTTNPTKGQCAEKSIDSVL